MSRKTIKKNRKNFCTACHSEAGILLVTLPSNMFRRTRTEDEQEQYDKMIKEKSDAEVRLTLKEIKHEQKKLQHRLCPKCIEPLQKKFGTDKNKKLVAVNMWGQGKQSNFFTKIRDRLSKNR